jgi:hypothetical protein
MKEKQKYHILVSLAFSTGVLGTIHMLHFIWLTAFKYKDCIRGYVPAGLQGLTVLVIASWVLLIYLSIVARRFRTFSLANGYKGKVPHYLLGGILAVPLTPIICSYYSSTLMTIFGYALRKDIIFSILGAVLMQALAVWVHIKFMNKTTQEKIRYKHSR